MSTSQYLTLVVVRGKDLAAKDLDVNGVKASSDPYCLVRVVPGSMTKRTRFIKRNLNPIWNHQFDLGAVKTGSKLQVTVWDRDIFTSDDFIGGVLISLDEYLAKPGDHLKWFSLSNKATKEAVGQIQLRLSIHSQKPKAKNKVLSFANLPPVEIVDSKMFGVSLEKVMSDQAEKYPRLKIPLVVYECIKILRFHLDVEGIFRISCGHSDLQALVKKFDAGEEVEINKDTNSHLVAGLLKLYLRSLPTPLLSYEFYDDIMQMGDELNDESLSFIKERIHKLPEVNLEVARELFDLLHDIIHHSLENKMTATNLAIVIGPSLLWSKVPTMDMSSFDKIGSVVTLMIEQFSFMFKDVEPVRKRAIARADAILSVTLDEGRRMFRTYDLSGNGFLDRAEFASFYCDFVHRGKGKVSDEEIDSCMTRLDKNGDGQISSQEFLQWWKTQGRALQSGYSISKITRKGGY
eukprot:TRINITY_DN6246_c0_g1_i1.p1 TRINITY_DN6246_c0_g1~~TRINITY_DN6246_c0_g1_i1.p1  ORF type:complete len:472 (-),score=66.86 TRINITY_DN6246_c0_g1_i1:13-1398(-)